MSYEPFSEGFCWECGDRLEPRPDGWSTCVKCDRWFKADGSFVIERIPLPPDGLGENWCCGDARVVMKDGSLVDVVADKRGLWTAPLDARYVEAKTSTAERVSV